MNAEIQLREVHIALVMMNKYGRVLKPLADDIMGKIEESYQRSRIWSVCKLRMRAVQTAIGARAFLTDKKGKRVILFISHTHLEDAVQYSRQFPEIASIVLVGIDHDETKWTPILGDDKGFRADKPMILWRGGRFDPDWIKALIA